MAHRSSPARLGHSRFSPTSPISSPSKESAEIARQIAALKAKYARTREAESRKASLNTNEAPSSVILSKNAIENDLASTKSDIAAIEARIQKTRDRHDDIRQKWNRIPPELQRSAMDEIDELTSLHSILSASLKRLKVDEERLGQSLKSVQKTMAKKDPTWEYSGKVDDKLRLTAILASTSSTTALPEPPQLPFDAHPNLGSEYAPTIRTSERDLAHHTKSILRPAAFAATSKALPPPAMLKREPSPATLSSTVDDFDSELWKAAAPILPEEETSLIAQLEYPSTTNHLPLEPVAAQKRRRSNTHTRPPPMPLEEDSTRRSKRLANILPEEIIPHVPKRKSSRKPKLDALTLLSIPEPLNDEETIAPPKPLVCTPEPIDLHPEGLLVDELINEEPPTSASTSLDTTSASISSIELIHSNDIPS